MNLATDLISVEIKSACSLTDITVFYYETCSNKYALSPKKSWMKPISHSSLTARKKSSAVTEA